MCYIALYLHALYFFYKYHKFYTIRPTNRNHSFKKKFFMKPLRWHFRCCVVCFCRSVNLYCNNCKDKMNFCVKCNNLIDDDETDVCDKCEKQNKNSTKCVKCNKWSQNQRALCGGCGIMLKQCDRCCNRCILCGVMVCTACKKYCSEHGRLCEKCKTPRLHRNLKKCIARCGRHLCGKCINPRNTFCNEDKARYNCSSCNSIRIDKRCGGYFWCAKKVCGGIGQFKTCHYHTLNCNLCGTGFPFLRFLTVKRHKTAQCCIVCFDRLIISIWFFYCKQKFPKDVVDLIIKFILI